MEIILGVAGIVLGFVIMRYLNELQSQDWGRCYKCKGSWEHLDEHRTMYGNGSGCFPLCEQCWKKLGTPEARLPYYRMMWDSWVADGAEMPISKWDQIEAAVLRGL